MNVSNTVNQFYSHAINFREVRRNLIVTNIYRRGKCNGNTGVDKSLVAKISHRKPVQLR